MRIAQLANFYTARSGGLRTTVDALGRGYVDRGDDVLAILPGAQDVELDSPSGHRVLLHSPALPGGYRVVTRTGAVRDILERFRPDVIEIHDRTTLLPLASWARERGIPVAFVAHERLDGVLAQALPRPLHRAGAWAGHAQAARIGRAVDTVVATTTYAAAELAGAGVRVDTVPLGVDLQTFHPSARSALARRGLAADDEALLLVASRLASQKRPELAVDAVRELAARGRRVRLVVAGAGPEARRLRARAAGAPVDFVGFVGERSTFAALLATADVVLAPGPIETFGLAALEALASGTPVVGNRASALPEVIGPAGVAATGTARGFADAVEQVLAIDARDRRATARDRAERFPWSLTVSRMRTLHARALAGSR